MAISIIMFLLGAIFIYFSGNKELSDFGVRTIGIILIIRATVDIMYNEPQAIDVYRGKTTLKITYEDSIPVDTVVVFKNK